MNNQTQQIKIFACWLPKTSNVPQVDVIETQLNSQLPDCERLLRWAIVQVESEQFHCEGAYLAR